MFIFTLLLLLSTSILNAQNWTCDNRYEQEWSITQTKDSQVLTLLQTKAHGSHFNTCYTRANFLNGTISLKFKANSGREDQGGGIIWRVIDADNYYIVRYNPLEDNLTYYYVKDGYRHFQKNINVVLSKKQWHTLQVIQNKAHYSISLDNKKMLEGNNHIFTKAGGVGVWSKADAKTSFTDISIQKLQ